MLKAIIKTFFQSPGTPGPQEPLVVAISGGPDSVALVHGLVELGDLLKLDLHLAHMNHALRGDDSDRDQNFVGELAERLHLPFHTRRMATRDPGANENTLRQERYAFLTDLRKEVGAQWIATGHTASDQAETLLLNLLRGAGPRGLGGMLPLGPRDVLRPLLRATREQVLEYLAEHQLDFREDASNQDQRHTRNRVRHTLLPLLAREFSPAVSQTLAREAELFGSLDDFLRQESRRGLDACLIESTGKTQTLQLDTLMSHHPVLVREILRCCLEDLSGMGSLAQQGHLDTIVELALGPGGTKHTHLPEGIHVRREYGRLIVCLEDQPMALTPDPITLDLSGQGSMQWGTHQVRWEVRPRTEDEPGETHNCAVLDLGETQGPVRIRPYQAGDRIEPKGMEGSQKVSRLLIDRKVPARERPGIPIMCDNGGPRGSDRVLWVIGQRRSRHACIRPGTSRVAVFEAEPGEL